MLRLARELWLFVSSVIRRLAAYLTGGVIAAAMALYERWNGKSLSWDSVLVGLVVFVLVAVYLAWRDEHRRANRLEGGLQTKQRALGLLLMRGQELAKRFARGYASETSVSLDWLDDVREWAGEVETALGDEASIARFRQGADLPEGMLAFSWVDQWRSDYEAGIRRRCDNLEALIIEIDQRLKAGT